MTAPNGNVLGSIDLEYAQKMCSDFEHSLRTSYDNDRLPEDQEEELAKHQPTTLMGWLTRWALLKEFYRGRYREVQSRQTNQMRVSEADAAEAARQLIRREPMPLEICGRTIHVTGRSYNAMYEIAAHYMRVEELEAFIQTLANVEVYRRVSYEILLHRRAIWAHALTPSGAPARSLEEAPEWWREIGPQDDAALLAALFRIMHGRYVAMGPAPVPKDSKKQSETFGWASLLSSLETRAKVQPASYFDLDLFQLVAHSRAANPPTLEEELDG